MNKNKHTTKSPPLRSGGGLRRGPVFALALALIVLLSLFRTPSTTAETLTFQYIYDDIGQLIKVIDSTGTVVEYFYNETGNRIGVQNSSVSGVAIFNFTPKKGPIGKTLTIQGQGFKSTISDNIVKFNGTPAIITAATANNLTVTVPEGTSTGTISVAVTEGTATSADNFTLTSEPVITGLNPGLLTSQKTSPTITSGFEVSGVNLNAASFEFLPVFVPPVLIVSVENINDEGTLANIAFTIPADRIGTFTLVATTAIGRSESVSSGANTLKIIDINTDTDRDLLTDFAESSLCTDALNPDTDGDGFSDGDEVEIGTDPCNAEDDPTDTPTVILSAHGPSLSVMNVSIPPITAFIGESLGPAVSIINQADPPVTAFIGETTGSAISVMNEADPPITAFIGESTGPAISLMNEADPPIDAFIGKANGPGVSILNETDPPANNFIGEATGPSLSIGNTSP